MDLVKSIGQFRHGDVGSGLELSNQKAPIGRKLATAGRTTLAGWRYGSRLAPALHEADGRAVTNGETARCCTAGISCFNHCNNPLTDIKRMQFAHETPQPRRES
ncbi:hypothetical protein [Rhizobium album]|uniref:hypothetical protein n=1 Tax=Metarhizobium album TaxID=2182425 RepID=UPI000FFEE472